MTACPLAEWDPLGPQTEPRMRAHDIVCLHTMAGSFSGVDSYFHQNGYGGTESHFGLSSEGRLKQWQDLDFQADANLEGNDRVISIETADRGLMFPQWAGSDVPAWTDRQIDKIVELLDWLCSRYAIPRRMIPDSKPTRRGIGYHRQGVDPWRVAGGERWSTSSGKVCPGDRRIHQIMTIVIPRLQGITQPEIEDDLEDDKMTIIRKTTDNFTMVAYGGKLMALTEHDDMVSADAAGIPVWPVSAETYDRLVKVYGPVAK